MNFAGIIPNQYSGKNHDGVKHSFPLIAHLYFIIIYTEKDYTVVKKGKDYLMDSSFARNKTDWEKNVTMIIIVKKAFNVFLKSTMNLGNLREKYPTKGILNIIILSKNV